ncbi:MAG: glycosyltransferase family 4 protein, partial [Roseimicrobium sp.]
RAHAWSLMQQNAHAVTRFIAPSKFYTDVMAKRLNLSPSAVAVVFNGLNFDAYERVRREPVQPTIGYLARMTHSKGLTTLVDAYISLAKRGTVPGLRLRVAGAMTPADENYVRSLQTKLRDAGLADRVTWEPNLTFEQKALFLHELTVFSVPATYGEAFGLYVAEAQACGTPVVLPRHGAFPEILAVTQGGTMCEPDNIEALATALETLLHDEPKRRQMSTIGKFHARAHFSSSRMAERFENVLTALKHPA